MLLVSLVTRGSRADAFERVHKSRRVGLADFIRNQERKSLETRKKNLFNNHLCIMHVGERPRRHNRMTRNARGREEEGTDCLG